LLSLAADDDDDDDCKVGPHEPARTGGWKAELEGLNGLGWIKGVVEDA
jgi:hypothetical protein